MLRTAVRSISSAEIGALISSPVPRARSVSVATSRAFGSGHGRGGKRMVHTRSAASAAADSGMVRSRPRGEGDVLAEAGYVKRMPDPTEKRARPVRGAERAYAAKTVADAVVAEAEKEWEAHLGKRRMTQLREALTLLREITGPYA
jgi:hypothetical protein